MRPASSPTRDPSCRYLDLLELALTGALNNDPPNDPWHQDGHFNAANRIRGLDWPLTAPTMIGLIRIRQLREAIETCIYEEIPGDLLETGVWRGGACIMMAGVLQAHASGRKVYVADSFNGLPAGVAPDDKPHDFVQLAVPLKEVVTNFVRYALLSDQIIFVPGWFSDTLPTLPVKHLAVLRLDGDLYESTRDGLKMYSKLSVGGFCIVDDYYVLESCRRAVDEFRDEQQISTPLVNIDGSGAYWRKP